LLHCVKRWDVVLSAPLAEFPAGQGGSAGSEAGERSVYFGFTHFLFSLVESKIMLQVMVVADSETQLQRLSDSVADSRYALAQRALSSSDWSRIVKELEPDVLLIDAPSYNRGMVGQLGRINEERACPVALFTDDSDRGLMAESLKAGVTAYVVKGMDTSRVPAVLDLAVARFKELQVLRGELAEARSDLATRKLVERAKGIIMEQRECNEDEAYRTLQKTAMDNKKRLVEVAREVILIAELLTPAR